MNIDHERGLVELNIKKNFNNRVNKIDRINRLILDSSRKSHMEKFVNYLE